MQIDIPEIQCRTLLELVRSRRVLIRNIVVSGRAVAEDRRIEITSETSAVAALQERYSALFR